MAIQTLKIDTCMGQANQKISFLTDEEQKEFNLIGYTGKNNKGESSSYQEYLNSLNKGEFLVEKIRHDKGDFCETFMIVKVNI